jgi:hypothetical protein
VVGVALPQVHPAGHGGGHHRGGPARHPGQHRVEERLVHHLDATAAQPFGQDGGVPVYPPGDRPQPVRPVVDRVHAGRHREQHLRGADVAGRPVPADVLLPGLQGEPVRRLAVGIHADPDQPAGQRPLQPLAHRHVAGMRSAVAERHPEALGAAHRNVGAELPRRFQQGQAQQVGSDRNQGAAPVRRRYQRTGVADRTGRPRVLDQHAEAVTVRQPAGQVGHLDLDAERPRPGADHLDGLR